MNGYFRIIIHAAIKQCIICVKNGIIISIITDLYADKLIPSHKCQLFRFFHLEIGIVPFCIWYIFHKLLLIGCRHKVIHFSLLIQHIKSCHVKAVILNPTPL